MSWPPSNSIPSGHKSLNRVAHHYNQNVPVNTGTGLTRIAHFLHSAGIGVSACRSMSQHMRSNGGVTRSPTGLHG